MGQLNGWAGNKKSTADFLDVNFYIDGDNKTGTKIGTTKANLVGVDGDVDGDHAFVYVVSTGPAADGKHHKLYAYAVVNGGEQSLGSQFPLDLVVLKPKGGDAEAIYNKIGFNGVCKGCHSFDYADRWDGLAHAGDDGKWTATDNYLYNKVHNHRVKFDNNTHVVCDKIDCNQIVNWWNAEFGDQ